MFCCCYFYCRYKYKIAMFLLCSIVLVAKDMIPYSKWHFIFGKDDYLFFFKSHVCLQVLPPFFSPNFVCQQTAKFLDGKSWTDFKIRIPSVLPLAGAAAAATTTQPTMLIARVRHCQRRFTPPFSVVLVLKVPAK